MFNKEHKETIEERTTRGLKILEDQGAKIGARLSTYAIMNEHAKETYTQIKAEIEALNKRIETAAQDAATKAAETTTRETKIYIDAALSQKYADLSTIKPELRALSLEIVEAIAGAQAEKAETLRRLNTLEEGIKELKDKAAPWTPIPAPPETIQDTYTIEDAAQETKQAAQETTTAAEDKPKEDPRPQAATPQVKRGRGRPRKTPIPL